MENYTKMPTPVRVQSPKTDLFRKLDEIFRKERLFLNPSLRIYDVCERIHTNPSTLSKTLKKKGFRNFAHFVNHYRIEEAKRLMAITEHDIYTLEAIANISGFGTRQTFHTAFVQMTGLKPARYRSLVKRKRPLVQNRA